MSFCLFRPGGLTITLLDSLLENGKKVVVVCQKDSVESDITDITVRYSRAFPSKTLQGFGYLCSDVKDISALEKAAIERDNKVKWLN